LYLFDDCITRDLVRVEARSGGTQALRFPSPTSDAASPATTDATRRSSRLPCDPSRSRRSPLLPMTGLASLRHRQRPHLLSSRFVSCRPLVDPHQAPISSRTLPHPLRPSPLTHLSPAPDHVACARDAGRLHFRRGRAAGPLCDWWRAAWAGHHLAALRADAQRALL
jgi:hypothetical protein